MRKHISAILISLTLTSLVTFAQNGFAVSGYVKDKVTSEAIIGALVYTTDKKIGVATNEFGFFSITIPTNTQSLLCSCLGYMDELITVSGSAINIFLTPDTNQLEAATIFSHSKKDILKLPQMGAQTVNSLIIKSLPAFMGESDIIKVIQMMPGVQAPVEGATGFSVRGGGVDQNLILMDGAPIYSCGHFLGFFSMFNNDVIKNAQLFKGDFPSKYGGKTSSVLDISTIDGNMSKYEGSASIGLIASKLFLEGPIVKDKASFMFSARRSYVDLFFPLFKKIPDKTKLSFYDINGKINWQINDKNRLYFSVFSSDDKFGLAMKEMNVDLMVFDYRNNSQTLRWNHIFSPKLFTNLSLYNSKYNTEFDAEVTDTDFTWKSDINETGIKYAATWYIDSKNTADMGVSVANYILNPSETHPKGESSVIQEVISPLTYAYSSALYFQNETKLSNLTARYGFRLSSFTTIGKTTQYYFDEKSHELTDSLSFEAGEAIKSYYGFEPRLSLSYSISPDISVKASYAKSAQYVQQAMVSLSESIMNVWFTSSPNVKPQISNQFSIGYNEDFMDDALQFTLELFYKKNRNTIDLKDNPGFVIDNKLREGLLRFGKSYSYGIETMLQYEFDKFNGWISYTWSKAYNKIDGINNGHRYRSPLNHEHSVNAILSYNFTKAFSASASWVYYSGAPTTFPVAKMNIADFVIPIYSERNTDSMPDYHRLDLSLTYKTKKRIANEKWGGEWNLSLYNAYGRHNAWSISTGYNVKTQTTESRKVWLFTAIPSVSYNINF